MKDNNGDRGSDTEDNDETLFTTMTITVRKEYDYAGDIKYN